MAKRKQHTLIKSTVNPRRTEGDYMSGLLNTVMLEGWQAVVSRALGSHQSMIFMINRRVK
jgi:hypothetical protein